MDSDDNPLPTWMELKLMTWKVLKNLMVENSNS